jgi:hypothetical protein
MRHAIIFGVGLILGIIGTYFLWGWVPIKSDWANVAATLVGVFTSFLVAWVGLIWPSMQHRRWSDRLKLQLRSPKTLEEEIVGQHVRYVHLNVFNENIEIPVQNVRVYIYRIEYPNRQPPHRDYDTGPIPLLWQFARVARLNGETPPIYYNFGMKRICDLGRLTQEDQEFRLETAHEVANCPTTLRPGETMIVHLRAEGDNAHSQQLVLQLHWNGEWSIDDEIMARNFQVSEVHSNIESQGATSE